MFSKLVVVTFKIDGVEFSQAIDISCIPTTPDEELERRAGNIFRQAALEATYKVQ